MQADQVFLRFTLSGKKIVSESYIRSFRINRLVRQGYMDEYQSLYLFIPPPYSDQEGDFGGTVNSATLSRKGIVEIPCYLAEEYFDGEFTGIANLKPLDISLSLESFILTGGDDWASDEIGLELILLSGGKRYTLASATGRKREGNGEYYRFPDMVYLDWQAYRGTFWTGFVNAREIA